MGQKKVYRAIGLMSGTSLDGVDAALIETDGDTYIKPLTSITVPYDSGTREQIKACFGLRDPKDFRVKAAENLLTLKHVEAVKALIKKSKMTGEVIGFHGQTLVHDPAHYFTLQVGDAALLAKETGTAVVNDFRSADVKAGGHGAPLLPLYHLGRVNASKWTRPLVVLNIGGVANVTWIGRKEGEILAFDTGPGNALVDDFILLRMGKYFDDEGHTAQSGRVNEKILADLLAHQYFFMPGPKSLDRNNWKIDTVKGLSTADGVATLSMFTVAAVKESLKLLPEKPANWFVAGGGRKNRFMMDHLNKALGVSVRPVESLGWNGDVLEAEGFAYLAVRSMLGLPLSLPMTTGVPEPVTGGVYTRA